MSKARLAATILTGVAVCVVCVALLMVTDRLIGPPSNRSLADAVSIGG